MTVTQFGSDCILTFTSATSWTIPTGATSVRVLLVGGGAGGAGDGGGGGGGGAILNGLSVPVTPGTTANVTVGAGGTSGVNGSPSQLDLDGNNSYEWIATGGSTGGGWTSRAGGAGTSR